MQGALAGKVWGSTKKIFQKNNVSINRIEVGKGGYCSWHRHKNKYNMFFVEKGMIEIQVEKNNYKLTDITTLMDGEFTVVPPGEYHRFCASTHGAIVYEIYWTDNELDEEDIERKSVGGVE